MANFEFSQLGAMRIKNVNLTVVDPEDQGGNPYLFLNEMS